MSKDKLDMLRTRIVEELEPIYGAKVSISRYINNIYYI